VIALKLASEGSDVGLFDIDETNVNNTADLIRENGDVAVSAFNPTGGIRICGNSKLVAGLVT
jgi:hypothetical protein